MAWRGRAVVLAALSAGTTGGCLAVVDFADYDVSRPGREGGAAAPPLSPSRGFALLPLDPQAVRRGTSGALKVRVERQGHTGGITVDLTSLPAEVRAEPVIIDAAASEATVTLTTSESTGLGVFSAIVRATPTGGGNADSQLVAVDVFASRLDATFGDGGIVITPGDEAFVGMTNDAAGRCIVMVQSETTVTLYRDDGQGRFTRLTDREPFGHADRLAVLPSGAIVRAGARNAEFLNVEALSPDGGAEIWRSDLASDSALALADILPTEAGVVTVGTIVDDAGTSGVFLRRLGLDGSFDQTFGAGGLTVFRSPPGTEVSNTAGALVENGGIVTCTTRGAADHTEYLVLHRVSAGGVVDQGFGNAGEAVYGPTPGTRVACEKIAAFGSRVIAAVSLIPLGSRESRAGLVAFRSDGSLASDFGDAGVVVHDLLREAMGSGLAADDRIERIYTLALQTTPRGVTPTLVANRSTGVLDGTFGTRMAGVFPTPLGNGNKAQSVRVLDDGRVLVGGATEGTGSGGAWFVARYVP
jgi:hypothetical protein